MRKQTEKETETLREPDSPIESEGSDRKRKREKKEEEEAKGERSMGNKSSSNHDRNQM